MNARIRSRIGPKYWSSSSWPFGDGGPEQRPAGQQQVGPLLGEPPVDEEVLLLRPDVREHAAGRRVAEPAQDAQGLLAERLLGAEERDLVVERLAGEGDVGRRDRQGDAVRLDLEEDRRGDVPGGVAARLERGADAARRERAGVGLALDQVLAGELGDRLAVAGRASGTSRASRRWSRSSARTSACSGWRRGPSPIPSRHGRPRRRSPDRTARGPRSCGAAS